MNARMILAVAATLSACSVLKAGTRWAPLGEGRLEIRDAELKAPQPDAPPIVPLRHTEVRIQVRGFVAEATVTQKFENVLDRAIEAEYVFPLPHDAAVTATEMRIGERLIRGRIARGEEAREAYEDAKAQGKRASLLEQDRPNIFTQSVANIGPGETIEVMIRYVQTLPYTEGAYELVFPMAVGPRYIPGNPLAEESFRPQSGRGRLPDTDQVPDASRITPPVVEPGQRCGFDIDLEVDIDAGVPIQDLHSRSHRIDVERSSEAGAFVSLANGERIPNKDFVLNIEVAGEQPEVGLVAYHDGQQGYFTLVMQPPDGSDAALIRPRELICVLDCSGSMNGQPLALAKQAAEELIATLRGEDSFNIIAFSNSAQFFAATPMVAAPANVQAGLDFVRSLRPCGGTEMITGIRAALSNPPPEGYLRIVTLFTDGYIGNETAIIGAVQRLLGPARLFAFGVGSSVNRYLLDRMAVVGRGTAQYILLDDRPEEAVDQFVRRLSEPVLTDIQVDFGELSVRDLIPVRIPDVFAGTPVYVHGRYDEPGEAVIEILGYIGVQPSAATVDVVLPGPNGESSPLPSVWARQRIKELELLKLRRPDPASVEEQITELALSYSLMSAYTSFVAVDETPSRFASGPVEYVPVSVPMPEGVKYETTVNQMACRRSPSGGFGGGPVGPLGLAVAVALAVAEWRRRNRSRGASQ